ncbi:hypothetical protein BDU57DRAFT_523985 [Ampelomyces quisqualis]|uniref:GIY-YIG domain-containing protein n=1 Tax=Ampelomyces quisqualis TaxID=50730 RepID=A0A6A5Q8X5_AMPQU|nr:hypothetical protein BDU57DRAFT_523985 [Ampelomyces quisqualis]
MSVVSDPGSSPSRLASHKLTPYANTRTAMFDLPTDFSPSQLEARKILHHVLSSLKDQESKYYPKYGKWVERHSRLEDFCFQCIRPHTWTYLSGRWSLDALKAVGGDLKSEGRGIYFDGVLGLDRRVRIYVGQANSLRARIAQHLNFRHRRDHPSLHYHAMQHSIYNAIGLVAQVPSPNMGNHMLPGMDCPDLLMNVLEMWMCLCFRTLPIQTLEAWLPDDGEMQKGRKRGLEGEFGGLNVACPLDQGEKQREWLDLSDAEDPLIRDYLGRGRESVKIEIEKEEEDSVAQRRIRYTERAKSYNKHWTQPEKYPSQTAGIILGITMVILVGTAIWRGGGYASRR